MLNEWMTKERLDVIAGWARLVVGMVVGVILIYRLAGNDMPVSDVIDYLLTLLAADRIVSGVAGIRRG